MMAFIYIKIDPNVPDLAAIKKLLPRLVWARPGGNFYVKQM
jgi:hypothetical protein